MQQIKKIILWGMYKLGIRYATPEIKLIKNRMTELKRLVPSESPVVVDGGAHTGEFVELLLRQYKDPQVYCYEPIPALAKNLTNKYSKFDKIKIREAALGADNSRIEMRITNILPASSILQVGVFGKKYHDEGLDTKDNISISQVRLDMELNSIDILKLDLQGYELEALKGSVGILDKVKLVLVEVEFIPLYINQALFSDIDIFMRENGFRLLNYYGLYTHKDGQLTSGDAIYLNNIFYK